MTTEPDTTARLLITCPDQPGIVAAVTTFLYQHRVNITELDQHSTDPEGGRFFLLLEFKTPKLDVPRAAPDTAFRVACARRLQMGRSEARQVGKECVGQQRARGS